ncbi:aldo/keto reductase [Streptomyces olivaceoviridis]
MVGRVPTCADDKQKETAEAVETALRTGYRHIDTAAAYGNEREVGEGIRRSGLDRSEVFIETKVWVSDYGYEQTPHAFDKAAGKLGVERIDLLILHQPAPKAFDATVAAYRALEKLLSDGRVRILTQAWSPIGGITFYPGWGEHRRSTLSDPVLREIADAHGKTPAQVMLRWHLQRGRSAIPKSTNPARIAENFDVFDFALSAGEITRVDALDTGVRHGPDPDARDPLSLGITIPEA